MRFRVHLPQCKRTRRSNDVARLREQPFAGTVEVSSADATGLLRPLQRATTLRTSKRLVGAYSGSVGVRSRQSAAATVKGVNRLDCHRPVEGRRASNIAASPSQRRSPRRTAPSAMRRSTTNTLGAVMRPPRAQRRTGPRTSPLPSSHSVNDFNPVPSTARRWGSGRSKGRRPL
jgi:hypothetical protein